MKGNKGNCKENRSFDLGSVKVECLVKIVNEHC